MENDSQIQKRVKELFYYDENTGIFTRKIATGRHGRHKKGLVAGAKNNRGYVILSIDSKRYVAHKIAWLYVYGYIPKQDLDHINRVKNDNRIANLRLATRSENMQNVVRNKKNTSTQKGVSWMPQRKKWRAYINKDYKQIYIGLFDSFEEAVSAYKEAQKKIHSFIPA